MSAQSQEKPSDATAENGTDACKSLDEQVRDLNTKAAAGVFDKTAQTKLAEIAKGAEAALQKYKEPANGRDALVARWKAQHDRITKIRKQLEQCYPDWKQKLIDCVCAPIIHPLCQTRKDLRAMLGKCQIEVEDSTYCFAQAEAQLTAWKDISAWLKKRLDDNDALIDEICKLDKCEDHAFALYIFYFELLRHHSRLLPSCTETEDRYDPVAWFCGVKLDPCCDLAGFPWLIAPERYKEKLGEAACKWHDAGTAKAEAEACLAWIEELRTRLTEDSKPDNKRTTAKQCLKECKPGNGENGTGTRPEPDPCDEPDPDPCPEPEPDPCEPDAKPEPDPCPDPKPDPDPYSDAKPEPDPDPSYPDPKQQQSS